MSLSQLTSQEQQHSLTNIYLVGTTYVRTLMEQKKKGNVDMSSYIICTRKIPKIYLRQEKMKRTTHRYDRRTRKGSR